MNHPIPGIFFIYFGLFKQKWAIPGLFFIYFRLFKQAPKQYYNK